MPITHSSVDLHSESNTITLDAEWSAKWASGDRAEIESLAARCALATSRHCTVKSVDGAILHGAHFRHPAVDWLTARGRAVCPDGDR
jgi:hypothetical protein